MLKVWFWIDDSTLVKHLYLLLHWVEFCMMSYQSVFISLECFTECRGNTYGLNCQSQCDCHVQNTVACNKKNGSCLCKTGWTGHNCSVDVKECTMTPEICGDNSVCVEEIGSFSCLCNQGFEKSSSRNCSSRCKKWFRIVFSIKHPIVKTLFKESCLNISIVSFSFVIKSYGGSTCKRKFLWHVFFLFIK